MLKNNVTGKSFIHMEAIHHNSQLNGALLYRQICCARVAAEPILHAIRIYKQHINLMQLHITLISIQFSMQKNAIIVRSSSV